MNGTFFKILDLIYNLNLNKLDWTLLFERMSSINVLKDHSWIWLSGPHEFDYQFFEIAIHFSGLLKVLTFTPEKISLNV